MFDDDTNNIQLAFKYYYIFIGTVPVLNFIFVNLVQVFIYIY